jgi:inorganic pyrophosphatase/exopolyphosphatase
MSNLVIASWPDWIDVDALWSGIGLYEIMLITNEQVSLCLSATRWPTITSTMKEWLTEREKTHSITRLSTPTDADLFMVDVSDYHYLGLKYPLDRIVGIIDHHMWSQDIRKERLGDKAQIESVGSCTTQITELAMQKWIFLQLSSQAISGLYCAILSNTLNFQSSVTTDRDRKAAQILQDELKRRWEDYDLWPKYFVEQEQNIYADPLWSLVKDTKYDSKIWDKTIVIWQLELWDGARFIKEHHTVIDEFIASANNPYTFLTIPSISEGKNYVFCPNTYLQWLLASVTWNSFEGELMITNKLWLRKEFIRDLFAKVG